MIQKPSENYYQFFNINFINELWAEEFDCFKHEDIRGKICSLNVLN